MEPGAIGPPFLSVVSPVEEEIKLKLENVTVRHLLMEELIALGKILTLRLAILRIALLVIEYIINSFKI